MLEELPLIAWNGTITFATVLVAGRVLMNGIYKKLDKHDVAINGVKEDVAYIKGQLEE